MTTFRLTINPGKDVVNLFSFACGPVTGLRLCKIFQLAQPTMRQPHHIDPTHAPAVSASSCRFMFVTSA
jgi:hypothetical protein